MNDTEKRFNLLDERWIPVITKENTTGEISIMDALIHADDYASIDCEYPSENFAITRLLIAILYSSIDFDTKHWRQYWNIGFDEQKLKAYADYWHERFYLIHPEYPFMQAPNIMIKDNRILPLTKLIPNVGDGEVFYTKSSESVNTLDFATAAGYLLQSLWYDPCGAHPACVGDPREGKVASSKGRVYPTMPLLGTMTGIICRGRNLKETLLLSAPSSDSQSLSQHYPERVVGGDTDRPLWEKMPLQVGGSDKNHRTRPTGVVNCLTFPTRRIRLFSDGDRIDGCIITAGDAVELSQAMSCEQMCAWKLVEDKERKGIMVMKPVQRSQERALWRGMSSLLAGKEEFENNQYNRPPILEWFDEVFNNYYIDDDYQLMLDAITVRYDVSMSSAITDILEDKIPLPGKIFSTQYSMDDAIHAVEYADAACTAYMHFVSTVYYASGNTDGMSKALRSKYYAKFYTFIQPLYYDWLLSLPNNNHSIGTWKGIISSNTKKLADEYASLAPSTAIIGTFTPEGHVRSINMAYGRLYKELKAL